MTPRLPKLRGVFASLIILAFVLQGTTRVLAGTTGSINGTVIDASTQQPIAGARVTASSPSQSATTTTDAGGHYTFASLAPDTYTVSVPASGNYDAYTVNGITVQADQNVTVTLSQATKLKVIGAVTSRSAASLVRPGTTADVYSIGALVQDKASVLGGGGTLNSAWSAISSVPGVYIAPNQSGYIGAGSSAGGSLSIRGGDYNQIGYEFDGIPVNRSFDNYPSGPVSSLGQQEVQVYTGAPPANAESNGLSGYINQVIKTGTRPAYRQLTLAEGSPTLYHKLAFEAGGANPSRTFSYYLGAGWYNQALRYADPYNGASLSRTWGGPLGACSAVPAENFNAATVPSCFDPATGRSFTNGGVTPAFVLGPFNFNVTSLTTSSAEIRARDTILNVHFGIPRKDGNRDDVQVLFDNNHLGNFAYNSTNDQGGAAFLDAVGVGAPTYTDGFQTTIPYGTVLPVGTRGGGTSTYLFPNSPSGRPFGAAIPPDDRDQFVNNQSILKLQYQRNFGTDAFFRVYGYTYYSDWLQSAPQSAFANFIAFVPSNYELNSHTVGASAMFSDQLNSQHLLTIQGSFVTANSLRYNNSGIGFGLNTASGYLVSGNNPFNGTCYTITGQPLVGCNFAGRPGTAFADYTLGQALNNTIPQPAPGTTCGGGPCQYAVVAGGPSATFNTVRPRFWAGSITDAWQPTPRLSINLGVRFDDFQFVGADTTDSGARTLFYNAFNAVNPTTPIFNVSGQVFTYPEWQPRIGLTYSLNPSTVVRLSYGRYAEAPNTAFEQYNFLQPNDIAALQRFGTFGLPTTPGHPVRPQVSNNYDASYEHAFRGDLSIKVSPFLRKTSDQIQQFFLDQRTNFVSGLNVGHQTSQGVELEVDKGDFSRNGFSGRLAFTYTNSYIKYDRLPNGSTVIDPINTAISAYNRFTAAGGGAACYAPASGTTPGAAVSCATPGAIANPYFNAPIQGLLDPNGNYATYTLFPGPPTVQYAAYNAPYVATLIAQYKHGPLAVTPAFQLSAGTRYGVPETTGGITPNLCGPGLAGTTVGDPRYNFGSAGGAPFNAANCDTSLIIPNRFTNRFDGIGDFAEPSQFAMHLQLSYDVSKRIQLVGNFANIFTSCFGGSKVPFSIGGACGYTGQPGGAFFAIGNAFNPGNVIQPGVQFPYYPMFGSFPFTGTPFQMSFEARIRI
jgi:hypothetical protein